MGCNEQYFLDNLLIILLRMRRLRSGKMNSRPFEIQRRRWRLSAMTMQVALLRYGLFLKALNPSQPRVPAGEPDGGQWTKGGDGSQSPSQDDGKLIFVADRDDRRYSVDLREEENDGGHALKSHVGKTDLEMLQRVRAEQYHTYFVSSGRRRDGSFSSIEAANDFVNRTLEANSTEVDSVADGRMDEAFITHRFGYPTGREAYSTDGLEPYMRNTYSVGVFIVNDPNRFRGYRIITAYPRNDGD